ncbi:hypothetical protein COCNU_11G004330 [Cocos nucifera]|uniref:Uncharacterized protein n=1 Tax=Cocos nucifera TaxID=13894 RepID=A0A8K0N8P9_COCNU|nr:hypothetical protein COCNU_11G004330 [Cocos nucifera]
MDNKVTALELAGLAAPPVAKLRSPSVTETIRSPRESGEGRVRPLYPFAPENSKGRNSEGKTTVEVLPRLCQIKYASGMLEELLYVDMPHEHHNASGQIVLDYAKAIQESVFEQLRVVREGQLRVVFSSDLKICSWEFCARRHEELIPRRLLIPQVSQLGAAVQRYQNAAQNASAGLSTQELQNTCNS